MLVQRSRNNGEGSGPFVLFVTPGDRRLSLKKVAAALGDKKAQLASQRDIQRVTGYQVGAVSVLGFRRDDVPGYVYQHILEPEQVIISAGRPDAGLALAPADMVRAMTEALTGDFCED